MRLSILPLLSLLGTALGQCPSSGVSGFASVGSGTTGGGNGKRVTVTNANDLKNAAKASGQAVIVIQGTIRTGGAVSVSSDKTIMGADKDATIQGGFTMDRVSNVIIKNLNIQYVSGGPADTLASKYSHHIWYDHLNVWDASDGLIDITRESDYQTVSWCKFWYSSSGLPHRLASLVGGGGGSISHMNDEGKLHVTYHHNYWAQNVDQRMPRIMYGEGHVYNNYFNSPGNSYCIGFGSYASVNIENNYFDGVKNPHQFMYDVYAYAQGSGNVYDGTSGKKDLGNLGSRHADGHSAATHNSNPFTPPYSFSLDSASSIPDVVKRCAGSGGASSDDSGNDDDNDGGNDDEDDDGDNDDDDDGNSGGCADMWGQCGGSGYTGPTCCSSGTCTRSNEWYSQCL